MTSSQLEGLHDILHTVAGSQVSRIYHSDRKVVTDRTHILAERARSRHERTIRAFDKGKLNTWKVW